MNQKHHAKMHMLQFNIKVGTIWFFPLLHIHYSTSLLPYPSIMENVKLHQGVKWNHNICCTTKNHNNTCNTSDHIMMYENMPFYMHSTSFFSWQSKIILDLSFQLFKNNLCQHSFSWQTYNFGVFFYYWEVLLMMQKCPPGSNPYAWYIFGKSAKRREILKMTAQSSNNIAHECTCAHFIIKKLIVL